MTVISLQSLQWIDREIESHFKRDQSLMPTAQALSFHFTNMRRIHTAPRDSYTWARICVELLGIANLSNVIIGIEIPFDKWNDASVITRHKENTLITEFNNILAELEEAFKRRDLPETYQSMIGDIATRIWLLSIAGTKHNKASIEAEVRSNYPNHTHKAEVIAEMDDYHLHAYAVLSTYNDFIRKDIHFEHKFTKLANGPSKLFANIWAWFSQVMPRRLQRHAEYAQAIHRGMHF